jgi:hypothetical protein
MQTRATDLVLFDERDREAGGGSIQCRRIAAGAPANHDDVELVDLAVVRRLDHSLADCTGYLLGGSFAKPSFGNRQTSIRLPARDAFSAVPAADLARAHQVLRKIWDTLFVVAKTSPSSPISREETP